MNFQDHKSPSLFLSCLQFLTVFLFSFSCSSAQFQKKSIQSQDGFKVSYNHYPSQGGEDLNRVVIVLPGTGGINRIDKSYAKSLSLLGAEVQLVRHWSQMNEQSIDLGVHQRLHKKAMRALSLLLKSIGKDKKVSLMGTSLGGIYATVAASAFDRFDRVLVIAAGVPIPEVIAFSEHESMVALRKQRFQKFGFRSRKEYAKKISQNFDLEPTRMIKNFNNKKLAQVVLMNDKAVPTASQKKLQDLWRPDKVIRRNSGHVAGIIKTWWFDDDELIEFLIAED